MLAALQVRIHAEQALKVMLDSAHEQQSALEDVETSHQQSNAETFVELRSDLNTTNDRVAEEVRAREAELAEAARQLAVEIDAREKAVAAATAAATAAPSVAVVAVAIVAQHG